MQFDSRGKSYRVFFQQYKFTIDMNSLKEEPEEIESTPVPKARSSAPVILSVVAEKVEEANDAEKSEDMHVGLNRHDYKTLSNTPKMKEYEASEKPCKLIKPHDYELPIAEVAKCI
jgi:hypothetical protein